MSRIKSRWFLVGLLALLLVFISGGTSSQENPFDGIVAGFKYSLVKWELGNLPDKWFYKVETFFVGGVSKDEEMAVLEEFFHLVKEIKELGSQIQGAQNPELVERRDGLERAKDKLEEDVEAIIEGRIGEALTREGFSLTLPLLGGDGHLFPPVDFELDDSPRVLVVSPRDRIELMETHLLKSDIRLEDKEALEEEVDALGFSGLVEGTGGLATYPSVVQDTTSLHYLLVTVAHEWVHQYLIFHPLGQNYFDNTNMTTINETVADIMGKEIGEEIYREFLQRGWKDSEADVNREDVDSEFNREMRQIRLTVDALLAEGKIEEAEGFMEERRLHLMEQGYYIRKLNQAFFAFNGTYADAPSSVSPIGPQLRNLREESSSLKDFMKKVDGISSYQEFLRTVEG